jgi:hypothetical protein
MKPIFKKKFKVLFSTKMIDEIRREKKKPYDEDNDRQTEGEMDLLDKFNIRSISSFCDKIVTKRNKKKHVYFYLVRTITYVHRGEEKILDNEDSICSNH